MFRNCEPFKIQPLNTGVIFEWETDVILSTHTWTVSVNYDLGEIFNEQLQLLQQIGNLSYTIKSFDEDGEIEGRFNELLSSLNT